MPRYVLLHRGGPATSEDLDRISSIEGVEVLEQTAGRALLVEAKPAAAKRLRAELTNWIVERELEYRRPEPFSRELPSEPDEPDKA